MAGYEDSDATITTTLALITDEHPPEATESTAPDSAASLAGASETPVAATTADNPTIAAAVETPAEASTGENSTVVPADAATDLPTGDEESRPPLVPTPSAEPTAVVPGDLTVANPAEPRIELNPEIAEGSTQILPEGIMTLAALGEVPPVFNSGAIEVANLKTHTYMPQLVDDQEKYVRKDVEDYIKAKMPNMAWILHMPAGPHLHNQLVHQVLSRKMNMGEEDKEVWFNIGGFPVRFGVEEFVLMSGLNMVRVHDEDTEAKWKADRTLLNEFWERKKNVRKVPLASVRQWIDAVMVGQGDGPLNEEILEKYARLLMVLLVGRVFYCNNQHQTIEKDLFGYVMDFKFFDEYPWGNDVWQEFLQDMKVDTFKATISRDRTNKKRYNFDRYPYLFQAWIGEAVPGLVLPGSMVKTEGVIPRVAAWSPNNTDVKTEAIENAIGRLSHVNPFLEPTDEEKRTWYWNQLLVYREVVPPKPMFERLTSQLVGKKLYRALPVSPREECPSVRREAPVLKEPRAKRPRVSKASASGPRTATHIVSTPPPTAQPEGQTRIAPPTTLPSESHPQPPVRSEEHAGSRQEQPPPEPSQGLSGGQQAQPHVPPIQPIPQPSNAPSNPRIAVADSFRILKTALVDKLDSFANEVLGRFTRMENSFGLLDRRVQNLESQLPAIAKGIHLTNGLVGGLQKKVDEASVKLNELTGEVPEARQPPTANAPEGRQPPTVNDD